jgi:hypothetical protein
MFLVGIDTVRHHIQGWCHDSVKGVGWLRSHTQPSCQWKFTFVISVHILLCNQNKKYMNSTYVTCKNTAFVYKKSSLNFWYEASVQDKKACWFGINGWQQNHMDICNSLRISRDECLTCFTANVLWLTLFSYKFHPVVKIPDFI